MAGMASGVAGQEAGDPGVIEFRGRLVLIVTADDQTRIDDLTGVSSGEAVSGEEEQYRQLSVRIDRHLASTELQEDRQLSGMERLHRATNYARKLIERVDLLNERVMFLGNEKALHEKILAATAAFDVPLIKSLLQEKLSLEDDNLAEAAFQLAGFQELDGEYQDAWGNYQRASNLEPGNQFYMDAHGKNEF